MKKVKTYHAHGIGDGKFHFALFRQKREAIHECGVLIKTICKLTLSLLGVCVTLLYILVCFWLDDDR